MEKTKAGVYFWQNFVLSKYRAHGNTLYIFCKGKSLCQNKKNVEIGKANKCLNASTNFILSKYFAPSHLVSPELMSRCVRCTHCTDVVVMDLSLSFCREEKKVGLKSNIVCSNHKLFLLKQGFTPFLLLLFIFFPSVRSSSPGTFCSIV